MITIENVVSAEMHYDYSEFVPEGQPKWGNSPHLAFNIDCLMPTDYRYELRDGLYFAVQYPFARYIYKKDPNVPDDGFGGSGSKLTMKDGSEVSFKGGWHTRPSVANARGFPATLDVSCGTPEFKHTKMATFIFVPFAVQILEKFLPEWEVYLTASLDQHGVLMEVRHGFKRKGMAPKSPDNWTNMKLSYTNEALSGDQHSIVTF